MSKPRTTECDKCGKAVPTSEIETVELFVCRQTHWSPAEYEQQDWCWDCRRKAEADDARDPDYERARARGWSD